MDSKNPEYPLVHLADFEPVPADILAVFPIGLVRRNMVIPVAKRGDRLIAVVPKTQGIVKPEGLRLVAGCPVDLAIAPLDEVIAFIDKYYPETTDTKKESVLFQTKESDPQVSEAAPNAEPGVVDEDVGIAAFTPRDPDTPDAKNLTPILQSVIEEAVRQRAREVLIEQEGEQIRFRLRIKGVLLSDGPWRKWTQNEYVEMIYAARALDTPTTLGQMKWTEFRRLVTVGSERYNVLFKLTETTDLSILSLHLHLSIDKTLSPTEWGMDSVQSKLFDSLVSQTHGLLLFCGMDEDSIGHFMRHCVRLKATHERHVIVVEKSMTERIPGTNQLVARGDDRVFGDLVKMNLRHLPDLLMVDPLSQKDHLESTMKYALNGSRIFGRFFSWDAADALSQMISMGLDPHLIRYAITGLVTQRTLRMNCSHCQKKDDIRRDQTKEMGIPIEMVPPYYYRGIGCATCHQTGFDKEIDIFEVIVMTDELRKCISSDVHSDKIRAAIKTEGMVTLRQTAIRKAIDGQVSLAEVIRTTLK